MSETNSTNVVVDKYPDFAVVWSFFSKFGKQLELENVTLEDVSKWITTNCTQSPLTIDVIVKLMRKTGMRVDKQRWHKFLLKAIAKQDPQLGMEISANSFDGLSANKKLKTLKLLCEMQFDENIKFKTQINTESPDEQRLKPVGKNEDGCLYWYQQDEDLNVRIYIEDQDDDDDATGWKVACRTKDEIAELIKQLTNESTEEKVDNSDNEEDDVVETKFQKFLKSQCNANSGDDDARDPSHDNTKVNEKKCNEIDSNPKSDNPSQQEHNTSNCEEPCSVISGSGANSPNHVVEDTKSCMVSLTNLPQHTLETRQLDESITKIKNENLSYSQSDATNVESTEHDDKLVILDPKDSVVGDSDKPTAKSESVLNDDENTSTTQTIMPSSTLLVNNDCGNPVVKLENIDNEAVSEKAEGLVKSEHSVDGNTVTDIPSSGHVETCSKQEATDNVGDAQATDSKNMDSVAHENNVIVKDGPSNKFHAYLVQQSKVDAYSGQKSDSVDSDLAQKFDAKTTDKGCDEDNHLSENIQGDAVETRIEAKSSPFCDSTESVPLPSTNDSGNSESEKHCEKNRTSNFEEDHSRKKFNTPKKKKRRRRAPVSRRRTRPSKQNSSSKSTTPKQHTKPKLSRVELLQKEAESIIQKDEEKETKDSAYRTRSGRRVKSIKHDQNESHVWQSIADVVAAKIKEVKDEDFRCAESKSRSTTKSDVEVTPKKPRRSRKNDLPCEKCGLFSHPTTILLCDNCNKGHHMACLTPPLMAVPEYDWFCPKCCKEQLIANLKEINENLETKIKLNERKTRQTERNKMLKEYTGISTTNIIATKPRPHKPSKRKKSFSSNSEDEYTDSDSLSQPSSPELKSVRSCRTKKVNYDFSSFDKTIRDAIGEVEKPDSSDEKPISGKDIRTIVAAQKGEEAAKKFALLDAAARRKKRKLTDLNYSGDEVVESGSNYSASSSEGEPSEEEFLGSEDLDSDESFKVGLRRSRRKKLTHVKPIKRSRRLRRKKIQEEYASDLSESSTEYEDDSPVKKKRRDQRDTSSEDEYQPPKIKPKVFIDDEDEDGEESKEPTKKNRVLQESSEDETNEENNKTTESLTTAIPKQNDPVSANPKADDDESSDDWSSISSNAEESFEDELSTEEVTSK